MSTKKRPLFVRFKSNVSLLKKYQTEVSYLYQERLTLSLQRLENQYNCHHIGSHSEDHKYVTTIYNALLNTFERDTKSFVLETCDLKSKTNQSFASLPVKRAKMKNLSVIEFMYADWRTCCYRRRNYSFNCVFVRY